VVVPTLLERFEALERDFELIFSPEWSWIVLDVDVEKRDCGHD